MDARATFGVVVYQWPLDSKLEASDLAHIASTAQRQVGFNRGYWGHGPHDGALPHAFVVFDDEGSRAHFAEGVQAAVAAPRVSVSELLIDA